MKNWYLLLSDYEEFCCHLTKFRPENFVKLLRSEFMYLYGADDTGIHEESKDNSKAILFFRYVFVKNFND